MAKMELDEETRAKANELAGSVYIAIVTAKSTEEAAERWISFLNDALGLETSVEEIKQAVIMGLIRVLKVGMPGADKNETD